MIFATCYLPALAMIMRDPNVGPVPGWMDHYADLIGGRIRTRLGRMHPGEAGT